MIRRTAAERREAEAAAERERWVEQGYHFAVVWFVAGKRFGPHPLRSMAEAETKRDEMIARSEKSVPDDRPGVAMMSVVIEEYRDGRWARVQGSAREGVYGLESG